MTAQEFDRIAQQVREHKQATSFPPAPRDDYEAHGHHAELGASQH
jgi:hypothetical protein